MSLGGYISTLAPEFILLVGGCIALMSGGSRSSRPSSVPSAISLVVILAAIAAALVQHDVTGPCPPGLAITPLVFFVRIAALAVGGLILLVNWHQPAAQERGEYMAMVLFALLGVLLTAAANDLLVLFFAIELVSVPTYVLVGLSRADSRAPEAAVKYFFLGALASAVLAYGMSFLYGAAGTTTIRAIADTGLDTALAGAPLGFYATVGLLFLFAGLSFKVAAVPFHAYAPDVYEGAASPVTALLGFVPKLAGFVALVKVLDALQWQLPVELNWLMWIVAAATMTAGNVLALLQTSAKRMLAYSSIAHTGYMLVAVLVGPVAGEGPLKDGVSALMFYITVYGMMNLGAFALLAAFEVGGRPMETLSDLAGLAARAPLAALALAVCVFSLMGLPPTAGFLGKLYIFSGAFSLGSGHAFRTPLIVLAVIGVLNSAIGAAYYLRIVQAAYMTEPREAPSPVGGAPMRWALGVCAAAMLVLFAWPGGLTARSRNVLPQSPAPIVAAAR